MKFEDFSKKVKKFSKDTVEEVQKLNEIRILNGQINDAKKQIGDLYSEIGKKLYEQYKESALTGFETEIQSITDKLDLIENLKGQVRNVKGVVLCPCCNMEVASGEKFCSNCGGKMPEIIDDDSEIIVEASDVVETEAAAEEAEAAEAVEEAAEVETVAEEAEDSAEETETETAAEEAEAAEAVEEAEEETVAAEAEDSAE